LCVEVEQMEVITGITSYALHLLYRLTPNERARPLQ
jgi:hypothetical protein